ncbi:hypothetical protein VTI74DRAFT_809 [Chaetomium olivicolor]
MSTAGWILKTPRVVLIIVFPLVTFNLYLVLSLRCINDSISGISQVIARSTGTSPSAVNPSKLTSASVPGARYPIPPPFLVSFLLPHHTLIPSQLLMYQHRPLLRPTPPQLHLLLSPHAQQARVPARRPHTLFQGWR